MCGGHALARARLSEARIEPQAFQCQCAYHSSSEGIEGEEYDEYDEHDEYRSEGTHSSSSSSSSDSCGECACRGARKWVGTQLPRVCDVDWASGHEQRARRLARLRASLLGRAAAEGSGARTRGGWQ